MKNKLTKIITATLILVATLINSPLVANAQTDKVIVNRNISTRVVKVWNGQWINTTEELIYRESDGRYVYCLQPAVLIEDGSIVTGHSDDDSGLKLTSLSLEQLNKVRLIAYYGYGYDNHNSIDWYFATQFLIWTVTETQNVPYPALNDTDLERSSRYDAMFNEINALVNAHAYNVSFNNQTFELNVGETKRITDTNKVLSKFYEVESNDALDLSIDGNDLVATAKKGYEGTIDLNAKENNNPILIYEGAKQICLSTGDPKFTDARLNFVIKTKTTINKVKGNSNTGVYTPEKDAEFELYNTDTNELVATLTTDQFGKDVIFLKLGNYRLHQTKGDKTHKFIKDYNFTMDGSKTEEIIYLNNEKIKADLVFTKTDFSTDVGLPNTLIEIYNADTEELVFSGRTDDDGQIIIKNMEHGKYYILEKEAPTGYELNPEKMYFEITEDGKVIKCNMKDKKLPEESKKEKTIITNVPDTEDSIVDIMTTVSWIIIASGLIFLLYEQTKKNKN